MRTHYTAEDKICPHCGGNITAHWAGQIIHWCDRCGSNNPQAKPSVKIN